MQLNTMEDVHQNYIAPSQVFVVDMPIEAQCIPYDTMPQLKLLWKTKKVAV